jgi:hypothetical protein
MRNNNIPDCRIIICKVVLCILLSRELVNIVQYINCYLVEDLLLVGPIMTYLKVEN